ncbi:hypothetical protein BDP27DRAFT_962276 [Rhodocollybia butyracea]|uniref:Uncharacterized protein n=1 Tax=Rhodocollybia butyracea TaxID=206335 RepID=A0A9P5Q779_9AGAR|nr:hypothetical protein BDP27DRAFT_962276 [Rhodocollybia butyracea]
MFLSVSFLFFLLCSHSEILAGQQDPSSRSHLSQNNYYDRGGGDFYDTNSISASSYDTGYDAASSLHSGSQNLYDSRSDIFISSSQYTDVHSAANDLISISSSRKSSGSDEQLYHDSGSKSYKDLAESFLAIASTSSEMHRPAFCFSRYSSQ